MINLLWFWIKFKRVLNWNLEKGKCLSCTNQLLQPTHTEVHLEEEAWYYHLFHFIIYFIIIYVPSSLVIVQTLGKV